MGGSNALSFSLCAAITLRQKDERGGPIVITISAYAARENARTVAPRPFSTPIQLAA